MYHHNKPCADKGLVSYRYNGLYGYVMIGARDKLDAMRAAQRSIGTIPDSTRLEVYDYSLDKYVPA